MLLYHCELSRAQTELTEDEALSYLLYFILGNATCAQNQKIHID